MSASFEPKTCSRCGRRIEWRKKWASNWDSVKYCSERCRRTRLTDTDHALEIEILNLLRQRGRGKTICPSEAARRVSPENWRELMERTRQAARRLVVAGRVVLTQKGHVVDPSTARGALRIRLTDAGYSESADS